MEDLPIKLGINWPVLLTQVVTFIILLVVLRIFAYKPVMRMLDERSKRVRESMDQAESLKENRPRPRSRSRSSLKKPAARGRKG